MRCSRPIVLLVLATMLVGLAVAPAGAATTGGALTNFEYQQLVAARSRLKSLKLKTPNAIKTAVFDCEEIQEQSPLLTAERSDCMSQIRVGGSSADMAAVEAKCTAVKAVKARLRCLLPVYRKLYKNTSIFYHSELRIRQIGAARHLPQACTTLLSDTPHTIGLERRMLSAIGAIIKAAQAGQIYRFTEASGKAVTVIAEVAAGQRANKRKLSICPHH